MASAAHPRKPRRPGRPRADVADLRARMLDAAVARFAECGIAATTVRAIATAAGVTPALLHYYFQSKNKLVDVLLAERIAPFVAVSAAPLLKPLPSPYATLRLFLETHMRNLAANPWMPRLMVREVLSEGGSLRDHMQAQFSAVISPKTFMLIVAAQRKGEIRADLDARLIGISMISLAVFPFAAAPLWHTATMSLMSSFQGAPEYEAKIAPLRQAATMSLMSSFQGTPEYDAKIARLRQAAMKAAGWETPDWEALIAHTLTLFDSMVEKPRAKSKR